ncbi:MAG: hypothetical protein WCH00_03160 [Candidatus Saccharibacteria bacterium]
MRLYNKLKNKQKRYKLCNQNKIKLSKDVPTEPAPESAPNLNVIDIFNSMKITNINELEKLLKGSSNLNF